MFSPGGSSTSIKSSIGAAWAGAHPGNVVDWDVALGDNSGNFLLVDNAFNLCTTSAGGGGFYLSASFGAGGGSTGPPS